MVLKEEPSDQVSHHCIKYISVGDLRVRVKDKGYILKTLYPINNLNVGTNFNSKHF